jgi:hypothetical protein
MVRDVRVLHNAHNARSLTSKLHCGFSKKAHSFALLLMLLLLLLPKDVCVLVCGRFSLSLPFLSLASFEACIMRVFCV